MRKKTQYIVVNEIYKTIYCGYPQKRAWKIITGSSGGMLLTDDKAAAEKVRKWSTQSRENAPWYQHEELGYNYRMSNVIAGVVRGQFPYLEEHIAQKKAIYERYKEGFRDLPAEMNPYDGKNSEPNFWLSCMLIKPEAMCRQVRGEREAIYIEVRLTSFGKMLRSTSLDELPELFNILNGDMSVVGDSRIIETTKRNLDFMRFLAA